MRVTDHTLERYKTRGKLLSLFYFLFQNKISAIAVYESQHTVWGMRDRDYSAVVAPTYRYIKKLPKPLF
jgi:hypothetical protein